MNVKGIGSCERAMRKPECTTVRFSDSFGEIGELIAVHPTLKLRVAGDVHGNRHRNKAWMGTLRGFQIDLPNLREVEAFARAHGYSIEKLRAGQER